MLTRFKYLALIKPKSPLRRRKQPGHLPFFWGAGAAKVSVTKKHWSSRSDPWSIKSGQRGGRGSNFISPCQMPEKSHHKLEYMWRKNKIFSNGILSNEFTTNLIRCFSCRNLLPSFWRKQLQRTKWCINPNSVQKVAQVWGWR